MLKRILAVILLAGFSLPAQAAPVEAWRVQQACALQKYLRATPAFPSDWGRNASNVSLGGGGGALRSREDPEARASFHAASKLRGLLRRSASHSRAASRASARRSRLA